MESNGFYIDKNILNDKSFDFQRDIVRWSIAKGRSAIFADCGLGKTFMQLEWAKQIYENTNKNILILAPLTVAFQTKKEGEKFGFDVNVCENQSDVRPGINITNYEKMMHFDFADFSGVVLDESSILKSFTGKVRNQLIHSFQNTPYKLACTATPAPNDYMELGNHAEFLGIMSRSEMLSMYFVHDGGETSKWRLKKHAENAFWQWVSSWAVFIDNPENLGYQVTGYQLPELNIREVIVDGDMPETNPLSLTERRNARKETLESRCQAAADIVNRSDEQFLVWCDLNDESKLLNSLIDDSVEVKGSDKVSHKSKAMLDFADSKVRCLVTKPSIAGYGMNWQNCHNMIFTGLSDSYEKFYQAIRRCYRFGQKKPVNVWIVISAKEGCVKQNIERKQAGFIKMRDALIEYTKDITKEELKKTCTIKSEYCPEIEMEFPIWKEFNV